MNRNSVLPQEQAPESATEQQRLAELRTLGILDTERDPDFDQIVELAATICGTPMSSCTLVDESRQWFKAAYGISVQETSRDLSFCSHAIRSPDLMIVEDTTKDERFVHHPWVTGGAGIRFYAGMPLPSPNGILIGTLCVADTVPRKLNDFQTSTLKVLTSQLRARIELASEKRRLQDTLLEKHCLVQALQASNDRFLRFMNNGPFLSYIRDEQGRFLFYSRQVAERFQITPSEWTGKSLDELFPSQDAAHYRESDLQAINSPEPIDVIEQTVDRHGRVTFWRSFKFSYPNENGRPLLGGISVDITNSVRERQELEDKSAALAAIASTDALTGLATRRTFDERLKGAVQHAVEHGLELSLVVLDIDNFKLRNDTFGHQAGDEVLRRIGAIIARTIRASDLAARYGGEEMIVLLPAVSEAHAAATAERIRASMAAETWTNGDVTASFGVASLCNSNPDPQELMARADRALYRAKGMGKNRVIVG